MNTQRLSWFGSSGCLILAGLLLSVCLSQTTEATVVPTFTPAQPPVQQPDHDHPDHQKETRDGKPWRDRGGLKPYETWNGLDQQKETTKPAEPAGPWDQWADMPPLRGDFSEMIYQVVGDIDWFQVAYGEQLSPQVRSLLSEAKTNLETSCKLCDEDPDLFAGTESDGESVRDVTSQLKAFQVLLVQSLRQPEMQQLQRVIAPARADQSKIGAVFGSLNKDQMSKMIGMFALETLQKRADQLVVHARSVDAGTFRPVTVANTAQQLKIGDLAPNFSLQTVDGRTVALSDFKGKKVVLVFNRGHF